MAARAANRRAGRRRAPRRRRASPLETTFASHWALLRREDPSLPEPVREYVFHSTRKWRADFCFVTQRLIVELEGGIFSRRRSGHSTGAGIQRDCAKLNGAILEGWRYLRYTSQDMQNPWRVVEEVASALRRDPHAE